MVILDKTIEVNVCSHAIDFRTLHARRSTREFSRARLHACIPACDAKEHRTIMTSVINASTLPATRSSRMENLVRNKSSYQSEPAEKEKRYGYALELPYSKQNFNFKSRITRIGRDLIIIGLVVCLLRTGYVSQWMTRSMTPTKEVSHV